MAMNPLNASKKGPSIAPRVLVVAPGVDTRGGIASVVRLHRNMPVWGEMRCELLSTFVEGSASRKLVMALRSYLAAPFKIARADVVHVHLAGRSSLLRKLPILAMTRVLGRKLIVHVHASSPESLFGETPPWATRYALAGADRVIALSARWGRLIEAHVGGVRTVVIPNPVSSVASPTYAGRQRIVLFAGKLEERKGFLSLLQAAPAVLARHPDVQFWFAGHGDLQQAQEEAERLKIAASVRMLGWTDAEELAKLYATVAVFCLPSQNEGLPMAVLEAMNSGTPVVCTPVGALPEVILDGENGLFANVNEPASLADKILRLLEDPGYAGRVGLAGHGCVQSRFGSGQVGHSLGQLYREVCAEGEGSPLRSAHRSTPYS